MAISKPRYSGEWKHAEEVSTWEGKAAMFDPFAIACAWYEQSHRAFGAVVQQLKPPRTSGALARLLKVLRESPFRRLPVLDSFHHLELWRSLKCKANETIMQMLVREEETEENRSPPQRPHLPQAVHGHMPIRQESSLL